MKCTDQLRSLIPHQYLTSYNNNKQRQLRQSRVPAPPPTPTQAVVAVPKSDIARYHRLLLCLDGLDAFRVLTQATMRPKRVDDFQEPINTFTHILAALQLRTTLKTHFVTAHMSDFLLHHASGLSLCAFSEQSYESAHHRFKPFEINIPLRYRRTSAYCNQRVLSAVTAWAGSRVPATTDFVSRGRGFNGSADGILANESSSVSRASHYSEASTCKTLAHALFYVVTHFMRVYSYSRNFV